MKIVKVNSDSFAVNPATITKIERQSATSSKVYFTDGTSLTVTGLSIADLVDALNA